MKRILLLLAVICCSTALAQETTTADSTVVVKSERIPSKTSHPEGVYATMESFLAGKPTKPLAIAPLYSKNGFFYYKFGQESKIKAFAISFEGQLYFQIKTLIKYKNKGGRSESHLNPNMFARAIVEGKKYIYLECEFGNAWSMGLAANTYGNMTSSYKRTGVVWDKDRKVFHIMKFCEDFNEFIQPLKPEFVQQCGKRDHPNLTGMQNAMEALNAQ